MEAFSASLVFESLHPAGERPGCLPGVEDQKLTPIFH